MIRFWSGLAGGVFLGLVIKPFEFDPFSHGEVQSDKGRHELVIDEPLVRKALRPKT